MFAALHRNITSENPHNNFNGTSTHALVRFKRLARQTDMAYFRKYLNGQIKGILSFRRCYFEVHISTYSTNVSALRVARRQWSTYTVVLPVSTAMDVFYKCWVSCGVLVRKCSTPKCKFGNMILAPDLIGPEKLLRESRAKWIYHNPQINTRSLIKV